MPACGKHLRYGSPAFRVGICEECEEIEPVDEEEDESQSRLRLVTTEPVADEEVDEDEDSLADDIPGNQQPPAEPVV